MNQRQDDLARAYEEQHPIDATVYTEDVMDASELTEHGQLCIMVHAWTQVPASDGPQIIGYIAETRLGFFPCDAEGEMLGGAERTRQGAEAAVRELHES